jgi:hypothetical protein
MKKSNKSRGAEPELPAAVLEKARRAFRQPAQPDLPCPDPEQVISYALGELKADAQQQVYTHLLTCRECLELCLDVRLARADVEIPADRPGAGLLARVSRQARELFQALSQPRRLIPALAAVGLVLLVVMVERQQRSPLLPPPVQVALERQPAPASPPGAGADRAPEVFGLSAGLTEKGLAAEKKKLQSAAPARERPSAALPAPPEPLGLELLVRPGGGARLAYRAHRQVFAYLFRQDSSGKISLLQAGQLEAGKTYFYPAQGGGLPDDAAGSTVWLVAGPRPAADLKDRLRTLERRGTGQIQNLFPDAEIRSVPVKLPWPE